MSEAASPSPYLQNTTRSLEQVCRRLAGCDGSSPPSGDWCPYADLCPRALSCKPPEAVIDETDR